jgi:hypothetical protein
MPVKYILLFILLQGESGFIASAQEAKQEQPAKKGCSCAFSSIVQIGALSGAAGTEALLQTVNGIRYKTWFVGAGIGIDYYSIKGYPLFLDLRKDLINKPSTAFVYADAGIHMPAKRKVQENQWYESDYFNGFYSDAGIGYKIALGKISRLLVTSGYSYKNVEHVYIYLPGPGCDFAPCYQNHINYISYLHRFSVKLGWQF